MQDFILSCIQAIICILGIPGNIFVLAIMMRKKFKNISLCVYMLWIALADLGVLVLTLIIRCYSFSTHDTKNYFDLHSAVCKITWTGFYICIHSSVWLLIAMTVEKFIAVVFPLNAKSWLTRRKSKWVVISIVTFVSILNIHHRYTKDVKRNEIKQIEACTVSNFNTWLRIFSHG